MSPLHGNNGGGSINSANKGLQEVFRNFDRHHIAAFILGLAALITNELSFLIDPLRQVPIGNIFLFLSAGALGFSGAWRTAAIGVVLHTLFFTGEHVYGLRMLVLCFALGAAADNFPRIPSFLVTLAAWLFIFGPLTLLFESRGVVPAHWTVNYMILAGFSEVILTIVSGAILLNPAVWGSITHSARRVTVTELLVHVVTLVATLSTLLSLAAFDTEAIMAHLTNYQGSAVSLFLLALLVITIPALLGWRIAILLTEHNREFFVGELMQTQGGPAFSGQTSHFWRRKRADSFADAGQADAALAVKRPIEGRDDGFVRQERAICSIARDGTVLYVTDKFLELAETVQNNPIGKHVHSIGINPNLWEHLQPLIEASFDKGPRSIEVRLNELPSALRFFEISVSLPPAEEGEESVEGIVVELRDITERRTVESHLLRGKKLESLGSLVRGVAHAFNNMLTSITGHASMGIRHAEDGKKVINSLTSVLESGARAGELVQELLDFADSSPASLKPVNMQTLLQDKITVLEKLIGRNMSIDLQCDDSGVRVLCDEHLLMQALTNLVLNARDSYHDDGGSIHISLSREDIAPEICHINPGMRPGEFCRIRVKDEGSGMSPEVLSRAFDPLFTTRKESGRAGLGLSIVFAIVRAHDGFLTAESHLEKGTTISIYLPITHQDADTIPAESPAGEHDKPHEGHGERILIADNPAMASLLSEMLESIGYQPEIIEDFDQLSSSDLKAPVLLLGTNDRDDQTLVDYVTSARDKLSGTRLIVMHSRIASLAADIEQIHELRKPFTISTLAAALEQALSSARPDDSRVST